MPRNPKPVELLFVGDLAEETSPLAPLRTQDAAPSSDLLQPALLQPTHALRMRCVPDLTAAAALLETESLSPDVPTPDVIVLCESRPGEHRLREIELVRRAAPLSRLWRVLGSWSEGEMRSGHPPAGCVRSYWHQWLPRLQRDLQRIAQGEIPSWAEPLTASHEERYEACYETSLAASWGLVVVVASQAETAAAMAATIRRGGYASLIVNENQQWQAPDAKAVLWDTAPQGFARRECIERWRGSAGDAPLLALVTFPRVEDLRQATAAGVSAVLAKPYRIADLHWQLDRLAAARPLASDHPA